MRKTLFISFLSLSLFSCAAPGKGAERIVANNNDIYITKQHDYIAQKGSLEIKQYKTMYTSTAVNMRISASAKSKIIKVLDCNTKVELIQKVDTWACVYQNGEYGYIKYKYLSNTKTETEDRNRWGIELAPDELELLAKILFREANLEPYNGQAAVVEVIFNRMSDGTWGSTLYEVLSAPGQFVSWKTRDGAVPTENNYQVIQDVLDGKTSVLSKEYLYFSMGGHASHKGMINIGNHQFCKS